MRQLTGLDTQILRLEDGRNHGHVSVLAICDPAGGRFDAASVRAHVAERLHLLAPLRWRLAEAPLQIDYPYWVDDEAVDLDYHLRGLALAAPGSERQLNAQVGRLISRPLDRARPLWELYVLGGLEGGRSAVLVKVHHAAVDGASVAELLGLLFDADPAAASPASRVPARAPGRAALFARGLATLPGRSLRLARALPAVLPHLDQVPTLSSLPGVRSLAAGGRRARRHRASEPDSHPTRIPRTVLNGRIGAHRRVALARLSFSDVKEIKAHYGVTVNDVVVAVCAGALRSWLGRRGALPSEPLIALVPVSVRTPEQAGTFGNRVSALSVAIPTDEADAHERLLAAHGALSAAKARHDELPPAMMQQAVDVVPPALLGGAARLGNLPAGRVAGAAGVNTCISNVPGARTTQHLCGARVESTFPLSAVMDGVGLNITLFSYCDELCFGLVVDRDLVDDPEPLAGELHDALDELLELVRA